MILVMETLTAEDVEGSKNLRVYTFVVPASGSDVGPDLKWNGWTGDRLELTVVANRTNVYDVGDVVAVAQVGSTPEHFGNFEVTKRSVFGVESSGMAVGTVDLPVGTILEDDWNPGE